MMLDEEPSMPDLPTGTETLLFTDMEGSTRLLQRLGEHYAAVLADCRHLLRSLFQQYNGKCGSTLVAWTGVGTCCAACSSNTMVRRSIPRETPSLSPLLVPAMRLRQPQP